MSEDKKYTLVVTSNQLHCISRATELLGRLAMGQVDDLRWWLPTTAANGDHVTLALENLSRVINLIGATKNANMITEQAKTAWDIHQVARQRLAIDNNDHGWSVHRHDPLKLGREPLATVS